MAHKSDPWKIISIASGKGGVGKTLTTVNIALILALERKKALILDGDFGLSNVDVVLGLHPRYNISDVFDNHVSIDQVVLEGPLGIRVIPSGTGITKLADLPYAKKVGLLDDISKIRGDSEYLLIDTGAGISSDVLHLNSLADETIVVTTPEPHSVTDAYAFMKVMAKEYKRMSFSMIVNMVRSAEEGFRCFEKLAEVARSFLEVSVELLGVVPLDPFVHREIMRRNVISEVTVQSLSGQAWKNCTLKLMDSNVNTGERTQDQFWMDLVLRNGFRDVQNLA